MQGRKNKFSIREISLLATVFIVSACSSPAQKVDVHNLVQSAVKSRTAGHEDAAANDLKEAFDKLSAQGSPQRATDVNEIYPELLELATNLRQLGRFSLSKTLLDLAIQLEPECTVAGKKSAKALKEETEQVGDLELNLLKKADTQKSLNSNLRGIKQETRALNKAFLEGDYKLVAQKGRAHLEVIRSTRGIPSKAYTEARRLVLHSLVFENNFDAAIKLLEDDISELSQFKDSELRTGDADVVEKAMFLAPALGQIANLQVAVKDYNSAEKNSRRAIQLMSILGGKLSPDAVGSQIALADVLKHKGENEEALVTLQLALQNFSETKAGLENTEVCLADIGEMQVILKHDADARKTYDQLIAMSERSPHTSVSSLSLAGAAVFYRAQGDEKRYEALRDKAIKLTHRHGESPLSISQVNEKLGDSCSRFSKFSEALAFYKTALQSSNQYNRDEIEKKIAMCKKNKSVSS